MGTDSLLSTLFGKTRREVLALVFSRPDRSFYLREMVRAVHAGHGSVQRELVRLSAAGILNRQLRGNQVCFRANPGCPVYPELLQLVAKTAGFAEVIGSVLRPFDDKVSVAFIYGSGARGELRENSDIDLLIVGNLTFAEVVAAIQPAQERLAREVNPTVYPIAEFRRKVEQRHHFLMSVIREPKLFLVGDEAVIARLIGD